MKWLAAALMLTFSTTASAGNTPFVVDSSADAVHVDINPAGGNVCQSVFTVCTLRAAIQAANANPGPDEITFEINGNIALTEDLANEDSAASGDLDIRCSTSGCTGESLTITGDSTNLTVIEAMGLPDRAFDIVDDIVVTIRNIEVRNTNQSIDIGDGTAIRNNGTLTLENVTVRGSAGVVVANTTELTVEGAISNSGTMTLNDVRVEDNTGNGINAGPGKIIATNLTASGNTVAGLRTIDPDADVRLVDSTLTQNAIGFWSSAGRATIEGTLEGTLGGSQGCVISENDSTEEGFILSGGVLNQSLLTIERCEISSNRNQSTGGGGIRNIGTLELLDSRVTGNSVLAGRVGGGLQNEGRAVVRGSLFENNTAPVGGGIGNSGTLVVVNSTVSGNAGGGISTQDRDAGLFSELRLYSSTVVENEIADLYVVESANLINVRNSIVANCLVPAEFGVIASLGFNFERAGSCGFETPPSDVQNITDLIGGTIESALALNGGFTETHRLLDGAPTSGIDRNDSVSCPLTDQRGMPRALGSCDVGAYEASSVSQSQCQDGIDNDADGLVDLADDGCSSASDNLEQTLVDGTIFVASDGGSAVFALPADYDNSESEPPVLARGSGLAGPYSVTGNGTDILVLDALQGLVFQIDLDTGIPRLFSSTGALDFPRGLAYGPDGNVFAVGSSVVEGGPSIVSIDPVTRFATTVVHTQPSSDQPLSDLKSIDIDENDDLIVSSRSEGVFRIELDEEGVGVATEIGNVSDPSGLAIRRTGDLLVVNRDSNDVVALSPAGVGGSIGIESMLLDTPRGIGIESEMGIEIDSEKRVQVTMIVSERSGGLHRIAWDGTTATETAPILAQNLPSLFGVWILRDRDEDGILDADEDSDGDGLFDNFETDTGIFIDADHAGTNPNNRDTDGDNLRDGFEAANGFDPNSAGDDTQDPDGDGFSNFKEQMAGTDPNDGEDFLFAIGIPAVGPYGIWILAPLLLLASRFLFGRRAKLRG